MVPEITLYRCKRRFHSGAQVECFQKPINSRNTSEQKCAEVQSHFEMTRWKKNLTLKNNEATVK